MTEEKMITIYRSEYLPMQEGDDEPELISESEEILKISDYSEDLRFYRAGNDDGDLAYATDAQTAAELLDAYRSKFYCVGASSYPTDGVGVWYADQGYQGNYDGHRFEATAHLSGFSEDEQREIYTILKARKRVQ